MKSRFFIGLASTLITMGVLAATLGTKRYAHYQNWKKHHSGCWHHCENSKQTESSTALPPTVSDKDSTALF